MPWNFVGAVSFTPAEFGRWKRLTVSRPTDPLALAATIEFPSDVSLARLRTGFIYPLIQVQNRDVVGPCIETATRVTGSDRMLNILDYAWVDEYPGLRAAAERFGAVYAPAPGLLPATAQLWRLTA